MPGIIGYVHPHRLEAGEQLLTNMAQKLEPDVSFTKELIWGENAGFGRVSLALIENGKQPVWNEDESLHLVMEGELFDYQDLKKDLLSRGYHFRSDSDSEFLLHLYEEYGDQFAARVNGAFVCAIWDSNKQVMTLANDHLGLYPLYYLSYTDKFLFASGVRALLAANGSPLKLDKNAIVQFLTLGHVCGDRTFFEKIKLLPPASILTVKEGRQNIHSYWSTRYPDKYPIRSEIDYREELLEHLRRAVRRQTDQTLPIGILLSGGLDSRLLLALLCENVSGDMIHAFTWGIPNCDEEKYARDIALTQGAHYHFKEMDPKFLLNQAEEGIRITDGFANIVNIHALANLESQTEHVNTIYKGFYADALMGYYVNQQLYADYDDELLVDYMLNQDPDYYPVVFTPVELEKLFTNTFLKEVDFRDALTSPILESMGKSNSGLAANKINHLDLTERQRRLTLNGVELVRNKAICRTPYCDKDLVEFVLNVPPGYRFERHIQKQILIEYFPKLSIIPVAGSHLPLRNCAEMVKRNFQEVLRWHLYKRGILRSPYRKNLPTTNYNLWFRTVLRSWMEEMLLSRRSLERGYFVPDFLRNLVEEQIAGADHAIQIGGLISWELMQRQFVD